MPLSRPQLIPLFSYSRHALANAFLACLLLSGCATQQVLRSANDSYGKGDVEGSLTQLENALKERPNQPELRAAYLRIRERSILSLLDQADTAIGTGQLTVADGRYQRVLQLDANNARARAGLAWLEREPLHEKLIAEARAMLATKSADAALPLLRKVLSENPANRIAQQLLTQAEDATQRPLTEPRLAAALQRTLSLDFKEASIKQVFEVFARTSGVNFIFDKDLKSDQKVTVSLKDSSVKEAIDLILLTGQLEQRIMDRNTVLIYPNTPAKLKDYQPLMVRTFFLASADAEQVANAIKMIAKTRDMVVDKKQNMLMLRDTPEAIRIAERIVTLHDLPEPEVMLEVEVLEINRNRLTELGIKFPDQLSLSPLPSATGGSLTLRELRNLNSDRTGAAISPLTLNARGVDTDVNLLANPRIRARNRETAKILIGDKVPNITSTSTSSGFVAENVQYLDVGLKLDVTPVIAIDNEIAIKIALEVSNIAGQLKTSAGTIAFQIGTRSASTTLRLRDGENQVLAGLISNEDRSSANKIPGIGNIPVAGRLFGSSLDEAKKTEIVLSITPRLIRNTPRPDYRLLEFESGTESSLRNAGTSTANQMPGTSNIRSESGVAGVSPTALAAQPPAQTAPTSSQNPGAATPPSIAPISNSASPIINPSNPAGAAPPVGLRWQGPIQVKNGDTFAVQLVFTPPQPIVAMPYSLGFDPAILEVVSVTEGELLKQGGATTSFSQRVDRSTGQVFVTNVRNASGTGASLGAVDSGTLLTLNLKALAAANPTQLQVLTVSPLGQNNITVPLSVPPALSITVNP